MNQEFLVEFYLDSFVSHQLLATYLDGISLNEKKSVPCTKHHVGANYRLI